MDPGGDRAGHRGARLAASRVARTLANNRPFTIIWCMGGTQHTTGNNNTRAYCIVLGLALGTSARPAAAPISSAATTTCRARPISACLSHSLPGYYGLKTGSWKHWAGSGMSTTTMCSAVSPSKKLMESKGIPVSRWIDGVLEAKENIDQPDNVRAMVFWGHAPNSQTRGVEMKKAMEKLDLLVVIDPVSDRSPRHARPHGRGLSAAGGDASSRPTVR